MNRILKVARRSPCRHYGITNGAAQRSVGTKCDWDWPNPAAYLLEAKGRGSDLRYHDLVPTTPYTIASVEKYIVWKSGNDFWHWSLAYGGEHCFTKSIHATFPMFLVSDCTGTRACRRTSREVGIPVAWLLSGSRLKQLLEYCLISTSPICA